MDDKRYYLDFGPDVIKLLGPNLYTNIYYVLGEIIANAYDADAHNVFIIYNNKEKRIIVEDDGNGMTYEDFNEKYLRIGTPTRLDKIGDLSPRLCRKRMGRKGIGKLSALAVSDKVLVMSVKDGVKSGCELSLDAKREDDNRWSIPAIADDEIHFRHIDESESGSSVVMQDVRYSINKTIESARKNVSRLFPFISKDFRIHLEDESTGKTAIIENNAIDIVKSADALITFTDPESSEELDKSLESLHEVFDNDRYYKEIEKEGKNGEYPTKKQFHHNKETLTKTLTLKTNSGEEKAFDLKIKGWICTYATLRDKKENIDFPINYISIISHGKLGRANIIPEISTKRTYESYIVGQFFIDLLEESELPDISASNRQGYKEDDPRYVESLEMIRNNALKPITNLKESATGVKEKIKNDKKEEKLEYNKKKMNSAIEDIMTDPALSSALSRTDSEPLRKKLKTALELKDECNQTYKKIMISHTSDDTELVNIFEDILLKFGFESEEILYTSSDHPESRPSTYEDLFEYLRKFFIDTIKRNDLCVVYIVNEEFDKKWNTVLEAGAGWVIKTDYFPMFTDKYENVRAPFNTDLLIPKFNINMNLREVQDLTAAIKMIFRKCGKVEPDYDDLLRYIKDTKLYKESLT